MKKIKRLIITGVSGFVARHFLEYLKTVDDAIEVFGIDINPIKYKNVYPSNYFIFKEINLLNKPEIDKLIIEFQPTHILHLASFSSVSYSWEYPVESFRNNTNIFLNLLDSVKQFCFQTRILSVGSSEEYGIVNENDLPIKETTPLNPISPYAAARVSQEMLSKIYVEGYNLDIVLTRSFNHIGPYQLDIFVIPSFIKQCVKIKNNQISHGTLKVGDISIIRDFVDVRDVVKAYYLLLENGKVGEIYNICSGIGISLESIIKTIQQYLDIDIDIFVDGNLIRPIDNPIIIGDNRKLKNTINWNLDYTIENSIIDIINTY